MMIVVAARDHGRAVAYGAADFIQGCAACRVARHEAVSGRLIPRQRGPAFRRRAPAAFDVLLAVVAPAAADAGEPRSLRAGTLCATLGQSIPRNAAASSGPASLSWARM